MQSGRNNVQPLAQIGRMAWPAAMSALLFLLMDSVDAVFLGALSVDAMAGAAMAATIIYVVLAFPAGLMSALAPLTARKTTTTGVTPLRSLVAITAILPLLIGIVASGALALIILILPHLGYDAGLVVNTRTYLLWRLPAMALEIAFLAEWALLEGLGDTRVPLLSGVLAVFANAVLNAIVIPGFGPVPAMGVAGAALATNLATLSGVLLNARAIAAYLRRDRARVQALSARRRARMTAGAAGVRSAARQLVRLGAPLGISSLADLIGVLVITLFLASIGPVAAAGHSILNKLLTLGTIGAHGIGIAAITLVARTVARSDRRATHGVVRLAAALQLVVGMVSAVVVLALARPIISWLSPNDAVGAMTTALVGFSFVLIIFEGAALVAAGILEGSGRTGTILKTTAIFDLALGVTAMVLMGRAHGMAGFYAVWALKAVGKTTYLFATIINCGLLGPTSIAAIGAWLTRLVPAEAAPWSLALAGTTIHGGLWARPRSYGPAQGASWPAPDPLYTRQVSCRASAASRWLHATEPNSQTLVAVSSASCWSRPP